jgi:undecaprenyl-diphosphatase
MMQSLDQDLFFFINHTLRLGWLDTLMPYWRSMYFWIPLYVFFISYLFYNFGKKASIYLLAIALTVGIADMASSRLVKKTVLRLRPCNDETVREHVKLLIPCGGGYSFTSSHATNHFALAVFMLLTFFNKRDKRRYLLLAWAASIGLGQVYVGVHYPFDILGGALLGSAVGGLGAYLWQRYGNLSFQTDLELSQNTPSV